VKPLLNPVLRRDYDGSPFYIEQKTIDEYMHDFTRQLRLEREIYTTITNKWRISKEKSMEEIIERWGWRESIFKELEKLASDIVSEPCKFSFLFIFN
jgi:hypothetical protein